MKRAAVVLVLLGIGAAVFLFLSQPVLESPSGRRTATPTPIPSKADSAPQDDPPQVPQAELARRGSPLAAQLNAPDTSPAQDVVILHDLIRQYVTALQRRAGPPIGDDADLVRALTGRNPLKLTVIPGDHPAISSAGRLLDRWGTPYHIHARSSQSFDIRSAGPDRKLFTSDDFTAAP